MKNPNYAWEKRTTPLTDEEVREIRIQYTNGVVRWQLARAYKTTWSTINRVVTCQRRYQFI
jgi:hypothetical protein